MKQYLDLLQYILDNGELKENRTGISTIAVFGYQTRMNLAEGFPLLTTKQVWIKGVIHELLWFLQGSGNIKYLVDNNVHIWDEWADSEGNLGRPYGVQWRKWINRKGETIDQIANLVHDLKNNPNSRRHILTGWNAGEINEMVLPPCHTLAQFSINNKRQLSTHLYCRSIDSFLGLPFNIASYALLTQMLAQVTDYSLGQLIISFGDLHIYTNHLEQVKLQLSRQPLTLPTMRFSRDVKDIDDFKYEDFALCNYTSHEAIKAEVAV